MGAEWPWALLALLAVPLLIAVYVWQLRRRRRHAVRYSSLAVIRAAAPPRSTWRRHAAFALVLGAFAFLAVAAARPHVSLDVPVSESALILALDVSGSMCATDVAPNRLSAAQAAVREFVQAQDAGTSIGLVLFSGFAQVAVAPTTERDPLLHAIDTLTTGRGTTIGAAILKAVDAISEIDPAVAKADPVPGATPPVTRAPGTYAPEIVVLLTDGANTSGAEPVAAAEIAAARGVRVYPIGFGTRNPTSMVCTAAQLGGRGFEGFGGGGGRGGGGGGGGNFLVADEATLREVARVTGGEYFAASDADRLQTVLKDLPRSVATQHRDEEISVALVAVAAALLLLGVWAAARWTAFPN
ncbi:VWA domain-containing protein [Pseudonocardia sp. GCM10023141]|uniref:VWA domain-containing protein n=1 Tax=Pseudonocardia sp. GCM10023141 TaxID=3252653 RepID=UPI00360E3C32